MCQPQPPSPEEESDQPPAQLAAALQALPPLSAPPQIWQRVLLATAARRVRATRRRRAALALAASLVLALGAVLLHGWRDDGTPVAPAPDVATLMAQSPRPEANRYAPPWLPADGPAHLVRARIGGLDAVLNQQLLQGEESDRAVRLRERAALMESLLHLEQHRQRAFVQQAVY